MDRYAVSLRIKIVKIHYKYSENIARTTYKVHTTFGHHHTLPNDVD